LDLAFETIMLRTICEDNDVAIKKFGLSVAKVLQHRLADICAATVITDLVVGNLKIIENGNEKGFIVLDLSDYVQIWFCANHQNNPIDDKGNIDWNHVTRIKIIRIEKSR
jgi:hypothetical protein